MKRLFILLSFFALVFSSCASEQTMSVVQKGPYTVTQLQKNLFNIQDGNDSYPPGNSYDENGKLRNNNCSDMYIVVGKKVAMLVDLSNKIRWADDAEESLRSIFAEKAGDRKKIITITHAHGDHTGMIDAFKDDESIEFILPRIDFESSKIFPAERTSYFDAGYVFDLGGKVTVSTVICEGHTPGSIVFNIDGQNAMLSGDAVGSGTGVWLFSLEGFKQYVAGVEHLISFMEDPAHGIDLDKLTLYGGHSWQRGELEKLDAQYVYDMRTLNQQILDGTAYMEPYPSPSPMMNANYKFGTATITWNTRFYDALHQVNQ